MVIRLKPCIRRTLSFPNWRTVHTSHPRTCPWYHTSSLAISCWHELRSSSRKPMASPRKVRFTTRWSRGHSMNCHSARSAGSMWMTWIMMPLYPTTSWRRLMHMLIVKPPVWRCSERTMRISMNISLWWVCRRRMMHHQQQIWRSIIVLLTETGPVLWYIWAPFHAESEEGWPYAWGAIEDLRGCPAAYSISNEASYGHPVARLYAIRTGQAARRTNLALSLKNLQ